MSRAVHPGKHLFRVVDKPQYDPACFTESTGTVRKNCFRDNELSAHCIIFDTAAWRVYCFQGGRTKCLI